MKLHNMAGAWDDADDEISEIAAALFAKRRFGDWTDDDEFHLEAWLNAAALHRVAWLRVSAIAACTDDLSVMHDFRTRTPGAERTDRNGAFPIVRRFIVPVAIAASVALITAIGIPLVQYLMRPVDHTYSTDVGGQTLLKFSDGTQIELNTNTTVRYRMTTVERTVWLENGEAWFHVAHNAANPFSVIVGRHRVTDIGTEFLVRRNERDTEVAVLSGRASLSTDGAQSEATLKSGDDAVATQTSLSITRRTPQELADELAWQRGVLVFRNARLADVVTEFNRYNTTKLVIADPKIADMRFSAELRTDDFQAFLKLAELRLNLRADRVGSEIIISHSVEKSKKAAHAKRSI